MVGHVHFSCESKCGSDANSRKIDGCNTRRLVMVIGDSSSWSVLVEEWMYCIRFWSCVDGYLV